MKRALVALAILWGVALVAAPLAGQCSGAMSPVNSYTPTALPFPTPSASDFGAGSIVYASQFQISIQAGSLNLCVAANTPTMGSSNDGTYQKPIGDLQVQVPAGTGSWVSVTPTPQLVYHVKSKNPTVLANVRILLSSADKAGTYQTGLVLYPYK